MDWIPELISLPSSLLLLLFVLMNHRSVGRCNRSAANRTILPPTLTEGSFHFPSVFDTEDAT